MEVMNQTKGVSVYDSATNDGIRFITTGSANIKKHHNLKYMDLNNVLLKNLYGQTKIQRVFMKIWTVVETKEKDKQLASSV